MNALGAVKCARNSCKVKGNECSCIPAKNERVCQINQVSVRKAATPKETIILCFHPKERSRPKANNTHANATRLEYRPPNIKIARPTVQIQELRPILRRRNRSRRSCQRSGLPSQAYASRAHATSRNMGAASVKLKQANHETLCRLSRGKRTYRNTKKTNDVAANTNIAWYRGIGGIGCWKCESAVTCNFRMTEPA